MQIGEVKVHPYCAAFPDIPSTDWPAFVEDIRHNGQRDPIWMFRDAIVDGKNRLRACIELGFAPDIGYLAEFDDEQLLAFVKSKNLNRRHMDASQRAMVAAKLVEAAKSIRDANLQRQAVEEASAELHVSPRSINTALDVLRHGAPELTEAVAAGEVAVSDAAAITDLPTQEQQKAVKAVKKGEAKTVAAAAGKKLAKPPEPSKPDPLVGCIPDIRKLVDTGVIGEDDAVTVRDLAPEQQRTCLAEFNAGRRETLENARKNLNRTGLSAKTETFWVVAPQPIRAESLALAVDMVERRILIQADKEGILDELTQAQQDAMGATAAGKGPKDFKTLVKCADCGIPMFPTDPDWDRRRIASDGIRHRQCPHGRTR